MQNLHELARQELAEEKAAVSRLFRFAVVPSSWDYVNPEKKEGRPLDVVRDLFFSPVWKVPFVDHADLPLLKVTRNGVEQSVDSD